MTAELSNKDSSDSDHNNDSNGQEVERAARITTCSSSSSACPSSPPRPSRLPFLRPVSPISPSESHSSSSSSAGGGDVRQDDSGITIINDGSSSDHCCHHDDGDDDFFNGSGICSFYDENEDEDDDDDEQQQHFHSIQHPSHIPTPSTIDEDDDDDDDEDDEENLNNVTTSTTGKTKKNWLTDEVLPNVGGAIVGGVSKLTLFLGGEAGAEKIVEKDQKQEDQEQEPGEETSENNGETTDKNNRCLQMVSNDEKIKHDQRHSLGRQYWTSKRNEFLLDHTSGSVLQQSATCSVYSWTCDDTDSVGYDERDSNDQKKGEEGLRDDSFLVSSSFSPPQTNSSLIASPMLSQSLSSHNDSKTNISSPTVVTATLDLGETSLHRKWVLENAFNLHSNRASQRILDDDEVLLSISMLTDDDDGDDDANRDGSDNDNDESENHNDSEESDLRSNDNSYHSTGSCILKDVPRSTFWDVYDTLEELSRSRSNPRKHKHKGRFTGLQAT